MLRGKFLILLPFLAFVFLFILSFALISFEERGIISMQSFGYLISIAILSCCIVCSFIIVRYNCSIVFGNLLKDALHEHGYELKSKRPLNFEELMDCMNYKSVAWGTEAPIISNRF